MPKLQNGVLAVLLMISAFVSNMNASKVKIDPPQNGFDLTALLNPEPAPLLFNVAPVGPGNWLYAPGFGWINGGITNFVNLWNTESPHVTAIQNLFKPEPNDNVNPPSISTAGNDCDSPVGTLIAGSGGTFNLGSTCETKSDYQTSFWPKPDDKPKPIQPYEPEKPHHHTDDCKDGEPEPENPPPGIPEPSTYAMMAAGLVSFYMVRRRS